MKDQRRLLNQCLNEDIPAIVFQGTDRCSLEILKVAIDIYKKHNCSSDFLLDFNLVIQDFAAFQNENQSDMTLPDLSISEKEILKYDQKIKETRSISPEEIKNRKQLNEYCSLLKSNGYSAIAETIEFQYNTIESLNRGGKVKYVINAVPVLKSGKELSTNIEINSGGDLSIIPKNFKILDKSTGEMIPFNPGDINILNQPNNKLQELLAGKKVEMTNNKGLKQLVSLNKTPLGWGISIGKEAIHTADSSAEI